MKNIVTDSILKKGLISLGLDDDKTLALLTRYIEEIELFNPAYGLVKVSSRSELIVKHILDSLSPVNILRDLLNQSLQSRDGSAPGSQTGQAVDVGSGAGLPGIPLAVCMGNDIEFTLIERMARRAGFLQNTQAVLGLSNVKVEEADVEELVLKPESAGLFDLVMFRAFTPIEADILKSLLKLLAPGGFIAAYKGRRESIEDEMKELEISCKYQIPPWEIILLNVPFLDDERHLLVIGPLQHS